MTTTTPLVGISRDFLDARGSNVWGDIGLRALTDSGVRWEYLAEDTDELTPAQVGAYDGIVFARPDVTRRTFEGGSCRAAVLARFGVGYDNVDLDACTSAGVAVTITPDGARRPVATATLTMLLALFHRLVVKDRLVRTGRWAERDRHMGTGLTGRTIGLLGVGNTASDLVALLGPFAPTLIGHDPHCPETRAAELGVELVDLPTLARRSDAVIVMAALTPDTHHLIDAAFLAGMRPSSFLVNLARGPIVDEAALYDALVSSAIAGAGLDVFEREPLDSPLVSLDNVVLSPHSLAWTDEMSTGNGASCMRSILQAFSGTLPQHTVNRAVAERAAFREKTRRLAGPAVGGAGSGTPGP